MWNNAIPFVFTRLKEETSTLTKEQDRIQFKLEKNVIFQQYLEKVLESAEEVEISAR